MSANEVSAVANGDRRFSVRYSTVALLALVSTFLSGSQFFQGAGLTEVKRLPNKRAAAPAAPGLTPSAIPALPVALRERLAGRQAPVELAGTSVSAANPFVPLNARRAKRKVAEPQPADPPPAPKGAVAFWGAFKPSPEEPKQAIIAVRDADGPWSGPVGSLVTGTPYRLVKIGSRNAYLEDTRSPSSPPLVLPFEGVKGERDL